MPDVPENNLPLTADGDVQPPSEADDGGCFAPFVPPVPVPPAPKPAPKPKPPSLMPLIDRILADNGCVPAPTDAPPETEVSAPAAAGGTDDEEMTQPTETLSAPAVAPLPPPRIATADELFTWIKRCVLAQTHLPADAAELIAFWVIASYFQDALAIPSFNVMASRNRKVKVTKLEPEVTLDFYEISNRGRKLPPEASEFSAFLKTFLARRVGEHQ